MSIGTKVGNAAGTRGIIYAKSQQNSQNGKSPRIPLGGWSAFTCVGHETTETFLKAIDGATELLSYLYWFKVRGTWFMVHGLCVWLTVQDEESRV